MIYLHGTCMSNGDITLLSDKLTWMKPGTKVITVSFPLTDYPLAEKWQLQKQFPASFTRGTTDVYCEALVLINNWREELSTVYNLRLLKIWLL